MPLATYASPAGSAPVYAAGAGAFADLPAAVNGAFASMRACTFTVQAVQVAPAKVAEGQVSIDGTPVPLDSTDGWSMPTPTTLRLNGRACATWRAPAQNIRFAFPCDAIQTN